MTYSLYVGENDTAPVWTQTKTEHPNSDGTFQSVLSGDGLKTAFADSKATFLGIRLRDDAEQFPRQEILAAPLVDFADTVTDVPSDPVFVKADVQEVDADSMVVGNLVINNILSLPSLNDFTLDGIDVANGALLTVRKPRFTKGVSLFFRSPMSWHFDEYNEYDGYGFRLSHFTPNGGLLVAVTDNVEDWKYPDAAPCITWPVGPGLLTVPFRIRAPVTFYFYEFRGK